MVCVVLILTLRTGRAGSLAIGQGAQVPLISTVVTSGLLPMVDRWLGRPTERRPKRERGSVETLEVRSSRA